MLNTITYGSVKEEKKMLTDLRFTQNTYRYFQIKTFPDFNPLHLF